MKRNRRHVDTVLGPRLQIDPYVPPAVTSLLTEAETSGGLLFALPPGRADAVIDAFRARGEGCWEIGEVGGPASAWCLDGCKGRAGEPRPWHGLTRFEECA